MSQRHDRPWLQWVPLALLALLIASVLLPAHAWTQTAGPALEEGDPDDGDYTIGYYADRAGSTQDIRLSKEDDRFELFIGLDGSPRRNFASAAFKIELPDFLEPGSAIYWNPIEGLKESELFFERGGQVVFAGCDEPDGDGPLILGRFVVEVDPRFREADLEPAAHDQHGLVMKLCQTNDGVYPERRADPLGLHVVRATSLWDRITGWFD